MEEIPGRDGQREHALSGVIAINEDIKSVMRIADEINLSAINAMLIANKIGRASSGFGVVSAELRAFSGRLSDVMRVLLAYVSELVHEVAGLIRRNKAMQLLRRAAQACTKGCVQWDAVLANKAMELARTHELIARCRQRLALAGERARKLCLMGRSLSYSAKIEAVYGGGQAAALRHVSERVEQCIGEILLTLGKQEEKLGTAA